MIQIGIDQIKKLRKKTHVGIADCKNALIEAKGDFEKAVEILRKKGAAIASKRAGNVTNEGIIAAHIATDMKSGALIEIGCETDFAANTDMMKKFAQEIAEQIEKNDIEKENFVELMKQVSIHDSALNMKEKLNDLISKISENIKVANFTRFQVLDNGLIEAYIHPGSDLGTMVMITTNKKTDLERDKLAKLAKDICMQVAVMNPICIHPSELDQQIVQKERDLYREQLIKSGKPENIIDKILEGKIKKYCEEVCLLNQKFIKKDKISIQQHINQVAKETGYEITIKDFVRFSIGK